MTAVRWIIAIAKFLPRDAKRGIAIARRLSDRPSVTLVDYDNINWKSLKLETKCTDNNWPNTFAFRSQTVIPYSQGNTGKFLGTRGGVGKVACWSKKTAISLKRVKIKEKLLWWPIGTHLHVRSFQLHHSRTPTTFPSPRLRFATVHPTQNSNRYYLRNG